MSGLPSPKPPLPAKRMFTNNVEAESVDTYLEKSQQETEYIKKLQSQAIVIYNRRGALCDSEGFYQHSGECWSDAIQQLMNNTDGIKEWVQYIFIVRDIQWEFSNLPDNLFGPSISLEVENRQELIAQEKKWALLYLLEAQKRFLRHYITENTRRSFREETCKVEQPAEVARNALRSIMLRSEARKKGEEGEQAAIYGKVPSSELKLKSNTSRIAYRSTRESYEKHKNKLAGGTFNDELFLMNLYNYLTWKITGGNPVFELKGNNYVTDDLHRTNDTKAIFFTAILEPNGEFKGGHALGFYECGGKPFFYEDNTGLIPFDWNLFLDKVEELGKYFRRIYFIPLSIENKITKKIFRTQFYPVYNYFAPIVQTIGSLFYKPSLIILYDDIFFEVEFENGKSINFTKEIDDVILRGEFNSSEAWKLNAAISCDLPLSRPTQVRNTNYEYNYNARLGRGNVWFSNLKNEKEALRYIEKTPLEQLNKPIRVEGENDNYVLKAALDNNQLRAFEALLKKGVNPNFYIGDIPFLIIVIIRALKSKSTDFFDLFMAYNPNISMASKDEKQMQAIHFVSFKGNAEIVKVLLAYGADPNATDGRGDTPLVKASRKNHASVVTLLCENGADPNFQSEEMKEKGETMLDITQDEETKAALQKCLKKNTPPVSGGSTRRNKKRKHLRKKRKTRRHL